VVAAAAGVGDAGSTCSSLVYREIPEGYAPPGHPGPQSEPGGGVTSSSYSSAGG
jgi:hypothetical protein